MTPSLRFILLAVALLGAVGCGEQPQPVVVGGKSRGVIEAEDNAYRVIFREQEKDHFMHFKRDGMRLRHPAVEAKGGE